jgi:hypothetical protein
MAGTPDTLPFATKDGNTKAPAKGGSGGNDFLTDPQGKGTKGGVSFDPMKQSRSQPKMSAQAGKPDAASIPSGGKILLADPGAVSKKVSGTAAGPIEPKPFKGLK